MDFQETISKAQDAVTVKRGDRFTILTPGAGGYGNPFERPAEQVADDVEKGFVTVEAARRLYGVVLKANGTVDADATTAVRGKPPVASSDVRDSLREAWDEIFTDADVTALPGDVSDPAHRQDLLAEVGRRGRLDLLVNNASSLGPTPLPAMAEYPIGPWQEVLEVNLVAPLALISGGRTVTPWRLASWMRVCGG